jgi:hypothetical protein
MPALRPDLANKRDSNHDGNIADRDEFGRPATAPARGFNICN